MDKFRVGEEVVVIKAHPFGVLSSEYKKGDKAIYEGKDTFRMVDGYPQTNNSMDCFTKLGNSMYEQLAERIEQIEGWDKETDDILQEINAPYNIMISSTDKKIEYDSFVYLIGYGEESTYYEENRGCRIKFPYHSQYEKLQAFKDALKWLLDNSSIPKPDKNREGKIERLEAKLNCIKAETNHRMALIQKEAETKVDEVREEIEELKK